MEKNIIEQMKQYSGRDIVCLGKNFLEAAKKCDSQEIEHVGWSHSLLVPIVVNMAFSCELFFKAILKYHNQEIKTHNMERLFERLPEDVQKQLVDICDCDEEEFRNSLRRVSNYFEEWRYLYERHPSTVEYTFLRELSEKLLELTEEVGRLYDEKSFK